MNYADEWEIVYYQKHGRKPRAMAMKIARHSDRIGNIFRDWGISDAREGRKPLPAGAFFGLTQEVFQTIPGLPVEFIQVVSDAWKSEYLEGYEKEVLYENHHRPHRQRIPNG